MRQVSTKKATLSNDFFSNYHIEICPADAGIHDRIVIQELVKGIAEGRTLNIDKQKQFKVTFEFFN